MLSLLVLVSVRFGITCSGMLCRANGAVAWNSCKHWLISLSCILLRFGALGLFQTQNLAPYPGVGVRLPPPAPEPQLNSRKCNDCTAGRTIRVLP